MTGRTRPAASGGFRRDCILLGGTHRPAVVIIIVIAAHVDTFVEPHADQDEHDQAPKARHIVMPNKDGDKDGSDRASRGDSNLNRAGFRSYAFPWPASAGRDDSWAA